MASIGVLAQLMQGMSPQVGVPEWNPVQEAQQQELLQQRRTGNETALLTLFDLKQKQASEAEVMAAIQKDPRIAQLLFGGGSTLGSLGGADAPGGQPAPTSLTQQTIMPGQPPGAPQTVPGGQDLSRFAGVSPQGGGPLPAGVGMPTVTPPQSTIASLGPAGQPQGPMQAPRNPLLEMAQRDPRAAMMLQQQLQGQQDRQWKLQEQQLSNGVKVAEYVSRMLQGVTDQNSLDQAREQIRLVHPQAAAQVPQMYSKEGIASVQQRGASITEMAQNRYNEAKARNLDMETQMFPELAKRFGMGDDAQTTGEGGATTTTAVPQAGQPAGKAGQLPPESEHTRLIRAEATRQGVDPDLAVAVATQESYLNPNAVGDGGKSLGYFQLQRGAAIDAKIDPARRQDPALNIQGGVTYLKQKLAQTKGDVDGALKLYNGGGDPNYVANVRRFLPGGQGGGTTGTAQTAPADPRIAQLETKIAQRTRDAQIAALMKNESLSTRLNDDANRLKEERTRLLTEQKHQQERAEAIPRKVEEQAALEPGELRKQRAAAEVSLEAKMNEPIGAENAVNMNLPPQTRWKDVPKDVKITKQLGDTTAKQFSEFKASHAGLSRVLTMLENPKAHSIIGTLFSGDNAAFRRRAGEWISSVTPQERKFVASLVAEIADIRHTLSGAAVSPTESEFLQPMMPSAADPDVATVRAKLEALQEWMTRKHDAYRDQFEQSGYRVPAALARTEEKAPPAGSGNVDKFKAIKP